MSAMRKKYIKIFLFPFLKLINNKKKNEKLFKF